MVTPGEYNSRSVIVQGFKTNGFFHRETMSDMMHMMLKKRSASLRMLILGITALMLIPSGLFFTPPALAQTPPESDPARFLAVKRWGGTIDVEVTQEWQSLDSCGSEDDPAAGGFTDMGESWNRQVFYSHLHYDVMLPAVEFEPEEEDPGSEALEAQMKALQAMAARMGVTDEEDGGDEGGEDEVYRSRSWGDAAAAGSDSALGKGLLRWEIKQDFVCPNGESRVRGRGSEKTEQIGASLDIAIEKKRATYSVLVGAHSVPGEWTESQRWRGVYPICVPDADGGCTSFRKGTYWTYTRTHIDKQGNKQIIYSTTDPRAPEKYTSDRSSALPYFFPVSGAPSAGLAEVDMDRGMEAFGSLPQMPDLQQVTSEEAYQRYQEKLQELIRRVERELPRTGMQLTGKTEWKTEDDSDPGFRYRTLITTRWRLIPKELEPAQTPEPPKESCKDQAARMQESEKHDIVDNVSSAAEIVLNDYKKAFEGMGESIEAERQMYQQAIEDMAAGARDALAQNPQDADAQQSLDTARESRQSLEHWHKQQLEVLKQLENLLHQAEALYKEARDIEAQGKTDLDGAVCRVPDLLARLAAIEFKPI